MRCPSCFHLRPNFIFRSVLHIKLVYGRSFRLELQLFYHEKSFLVDRGLRSNIGDKYYNLEYCFMLHRNDNQYKTLYLSVK
jgi:hypothetical protein